MKIRKNMIKLLSVTLLIMLGILQVEAQFLPADEIFHRTSRQSVLCPPEKVYLHTDRSTYVAGETIWMRAHVVDGIAHVPMKLSAYVYVTLQNPFLETVAQVRLKADEDGFIHGNIPLPEDLPKGEYSLCAYTKYMQNFDETYFFKKRITINNVMNNSIRLKTELKGRKLNVGFVNPVTGEMKKIQNISARTISEEIPVLKSDSGYAIKFHESKEKNLLVQAGNYREFLVFDVKLDYDVAFLPEGGNLVSGVFNRVAFKCINSLGQGENIEGTLRDKNDSILLSFKSLYRGMGTFSFIPERGKSYKVVCKNKTGRVKHFVLPEAEDRYSLQVNQIRDKIYVKVLYSPYENFDEKLLVVAHQRGWPVKVGNWRKKVSGLVCNREDFMEGVASFLLVDESGRIVSERMLFVQKGNRLVGTIQSDKSHLKKREKVGLKIQLPEKWWNGNCSVSVTDNKDVLPDSCDNILSSLLVSADLRGYVETPAWYFREDDEDTKEYRRHALDALMMTQGWRKYDFQAVWKENYKEPNLLPERSQQISGIVMRAITRKPIEKAKVQLMIPLMALKEELNTGKDGKFLFENFDAPDSTEYWISAYTKNNKDNVVIKLDTVILPTLKDKLPPSCPEGMLSRQDNMTLEYLAKADLKSVYEKGIRHIFLDEVIVTASEIQPKTEYETLIGAKSVKSEELESSGVDDFLTMLRQQFPGLQVYGDGGGNVSLGFRNEPVSVFLDGIRYEPGTYGFIGRLDKNDIEQLDLVKSPYSLTYDPMVSGGVLAITTKRGNAKFNAKWEVTNLKMIMPLGYQPPVEFYAPKYEFIADKEKDVPDLRTTIHWQPCLEVKNGRADIEFYTADGIVDYTVVIEGVGEDGSLLRVEKRIE